MDGNPLAVLAPAQRIDGNALAVLAPAQRMDGNPLAVLAAANAAHGAHARGPAQPAARNTNDS